MMERFTKRQKKNTEKIDVFEPFWELYYGSPFGDVDEFHLQFLLLFNDAFSLKNHAFSVDTEKRILLVNYTNLANSIVKVYKNQGIESHKEKLDEVKEYIRNEPEHALKTLGLVGAKNIFETSQSMRTFYMLTKLTVRIHNCEPITPMKSIKSNMYKKLVTVRGTVVRTSITRPFLVKTQFNCIRCGRKQIISASDGKYITPTRCFTPGCKNPKFLADKNSFSETKTIDWQQLRIQEKIGDDKTEHGRMPRSVVIELTEDLTDSVVPGDFVQCTGILKVLSSEEGRGKQKPNSLYSLYIDAISVNKVGDSNDGKSDPKNSNIAGFTPADYEFIREVYNQPNLFKLLVQSLSPAIFGHEMVKAGLLLGIFGARQRDSNIKGRLSIRHNPHILVVGDPGLGKSQMLTAAASVATRGVYVCGSSGISTTGLTVTLVKESGSGDFALEAGALVLSDQGCCCIDEFDKMSSNHDALLEAMEQQSVSIAKAGMVCTLPARASVLAAANPVGGHYNKSKTVSENLKMSSALLSRFDLVFILLDRPNAEKDKYLSEHVMKLHSGVSHEERLRWNSDFSSTQLLNQNPQSLQRSLELNPGEEIDLIPKSLLKVYIAYARKYVHPRLSERAKDIFQEFYLGLRLKHQSDSMPITNRQLEALIRLGEARARAELREIVTGQDAEDVIQIMESSLLQTYENEAGMLDFQRSQMGSGMSKQNEVKRFVAHLARIGRERFNNTFTVEMLKTAAQEINISFENFSDTLENINNQGYILKKGNGLFKLTM
ncbi:hypothetical protein BB559_003743 [Furculomyces boomerangus]|uniref:Minichromosome maintenance 8 n=1 Tax=Furculomyces boomerangus TaxID=61424 RepID=A0A2T9YJ46_9FUNG|nr:hypothetical protein BB559_005647 [Furculomyces boomerangus]PVU92351.1 hypothetical protein BB559_003743 [Furculomyces boomerangus]